MPQFHGQNQSTSVVSDGSNYGLIFSISISFKVFLFNKTNMFLNFCEAILVYHNWFWNQLFEVWYNDT